MNSVKLRTSMLEKGKTMREISQFMHISEQAFYNKLYGKTEFKSSEILKLTAFLNLSMEQVNEIFFDSMVN